MAATAYPLSWPDGLPRTTTRATSAFKTALPAALANVARWRSDRLTE